VRGLIALRLLDAPGQAGFGQQPGDEGPVGLAVLGGDRTYRQSACTSKRNTACG
jgi:hypothetical protein